MNTTNILIKLEHKKTVDKYSQIILSEKNHNSISSNSVPLLTGEAKV